MLVVQKGICDRAEKVTVWFFSLVKTDIGNNVAYCSGSRAHCGFNIARNYY